MKIVSATPKFYSPVPFQTNSLGPAHGCGAYVTALPKFRSTVPFQTNSLGPAHGCGSYYSPTAAVPVPALKGFGATMRSADSTGSTGIGLGVGLASIAIPLLIWAGIRGYSSYYVGKSLGAPAAGGLAGFFFGTLGLAVVAGARKGTAVANRRRKARRNRRRSRR